MASDAAVKLARRAWSSQTAVPNSTVPPSTFQGVVATSICKKTGAICPQASSLKPGLKRSCFSQGGVCGCGNCQPNCYDSLLQNAMLNQLGWSSTFDGCIGHPQKLCFDKGDLPRSQLACAGRANSCAGVSRSGSPETIGDLIPGATGGTTIAIMDINNVWNRAGAPTGGQTAGWLYLGSNGVRYFQSAFQNQALWAGGFTAPFFGAFGLSVTQAGGYGCVIPWTSSFPVSAFAVKCESQGATLV